MNRRRPPKQPDLFATSTIAPPTKPETRRFYEAVLLLRLCQRETVFRQGDDLHLVGGRQMTTRELMRLALRGRSQAWAMARIRREAAIERAWRNFG